MISYKSGKEGSLITSHWQLVVNQNQKHYQYIYEGKSNSMHTFWCAFYFWLESYPYEWKLPKYSLTLWKLALALLCQRKAKTKPVMLETSLQVICTLTESGCSRKCLLLMNRGESIHTWNSHMETHQHAAQLAGLVLHPLACICSKGPLIQWCQHLVSLRSYQQIPSTPEWKTSAELITSNIDALFP